MDRVVHSPHPSLHSTRQGWDNGNGILLLSKPAAFRVNVFLTSLTSSYPLSLWDDERKKYKVGRLSSFLAPEGLAGNNNVWADFLSLGLSLPVSKLIQGLLG